MSENSVDMEVVEEKPAFHCPVCGEPQTKFYRIKGERYVYCPSCKARIRADKVPKEFRVSVDKRALEDLLSIHEVKTERKEEKEGEEDETRTTTSTETMKKPSGPIELFERPKSPHEILEEVLRAYNVNEEFIRIAVRRSKIMGGLHPTTLRQMLQTMKISGVKDRETAAFIAEEYYYALLKEREKAERLGVTMNYPLEPISARTSYEGGYYLPTYETPHRRFEFAMDYHRPYSYPPHERPLTREEVMEMMRRLLEEKRQRDVIEELRDRYHELEKRTSEMINKVVENISRSFEDVSKRIMDMINELRRQTITKEELEVKLREREANAYIKYLEERSKEQEKLINTILEAWRKEREELAKRLEEISRRSHSPSTGYKSDEYRFLADSLDRFASIIEKRKPIEVIVRQLPAILYPTVAIESAKPKVEETSSTLYELMLKEAKEYVE